MEGKHNKILKISKSCIFKKVSDKKQNKRRSKYGVYKAVEFKIRGQGKPSWKIDLGSKDSRSEETLREQSGDWGVQAERTQN